MKILKPVIALVYDFDGTLTPSSMQNYTVLPGLGVKDHNLFWDDISNESRKIKAEPNLVWMQKIIELASKKNVPLTTDYFKDQGGSIAYYPGIPGFFPSMDALVKDASRGKMELRHYIVSSGLKEILEGTAIRRYFYNVFGSEYMYNDRGTAFFPKVVITDTIKTQYLFRINKGIENISESINESMPDTDRPVPFSNILYVGDGLTDVPAMNVTRKNGGHAVAVYDPSNLKGKETCIALKNAGRADFIAEADYRKESSLFEYIKARLELLVKENG